MLELLFGICMIVVFAKLLKFALKATWGVTKIVVNIILLPLFLIGLVFKGLLNLAFPILIIVGIALILCSKK